MLIFSVIFLSGDSFFCCCKILCKHNYVDFVNFMKLSNIAIGENRCEMGKSDENGLNTVS